MKTLKDKMNCAIFGKDLTLNNKTDIIKEKLHSYYHTTYPYSFNNLTQYHGSKMDSSLNHITGVVCYVAYLNDCLIKKNFSGLPVKIAKDLKTVSKRGVESFYMAIVFNMIMREVHNIKNISLIQGFYDFNLINSPLTNTGLHAYSLLDGEKVIDVTIFSMNESYANKEIAIVGEVPSDMRMYGWEESVGSEQLYIEEFAKMNHKYGYVEWLASHLEAYQDFEIYVLTQEKDTQN